MVINNSQHYFYVSNGTILKDEKDLLNLLEKIDEKTLKNHFNSEKNDFASWVKEIIQDKPLAKKLEKAKTIKGLISALEKSKPRRDKKAIISQIKEAING